VKELAMAPKDVPRDKVFLIAYSADGNALERFEMSYDDYYEQDCQLIDSDEFRAQHKIRRVTGEIYDSSGVLQQKFENHYDEAGAYSRGRGVHADGTVTEN